MNEQAFGVLEYDGLRALVRRGAQTPMGRARADALAPMDDLDAVRRALRAVSECLELRRRGAGWSFSELTDPSESIARLKIEGALLDPLALLELARLCDQAGEARARIQSERDAAPALWESVAGLPRELYSLTRRSRTSWSRSATTASSSPSAPITAGASRASRTAPRRRG
ncbi:MAG: hypothetical protein LC785_14445 [Acidobacteria bacterium]|nr:hypothetical protein [Acidobacteriota bacterium]